MSERYQLMLEMKKAEARLQRARNAIKKATARAVEANKAYMELFDAHVLQRMETGDLSALFEYTTNPKVVVAVNAWAEAAGVQIGGQSIDTLKRVVTIALHRENSYRLTLESVRILLPHIPEQVDGKNRKFKKVGIKERHLSADGCWSLVVRGDDILLCRMLYGRLSDLSFASLEDAFHFIQSDLWYNSDIYKDD